MAAFHPYRNSRRRSYRKRTLSMRVRLGNFSLSVVLIALMCVLSVAQVLHTNNIQTKGYEIRELEQEKQVLLVKHKALKMAVTEAQSLAAIKDSDVVENMQLVVDPIVIPRENVVAVK